MLKIVLPVAMVGFYPQELGGIENIFKFQRNNGIHLGNQASGYTSFYYDLTPYLNYGEEENVLAVRVDNSEQPNSRWYSGSGIYRHTWLILTEKVHVDQWGTFVSTPKVTDKFAEIKAVTRVAMKRKKR
ncbi:MAG TPA: sugar-binding domain-containing protein [Ruminiclostridium sp.]